MTEKFTQEDKEFLYQIFADNDHEVREGAKTKDGKKIQWFVYLTWEAIQRHLDERYFGEWSDEYHSHRDLNGYSEVYCRITIRGFSRENNGSNSGNSNQDEHQGKGASTDAFKRTAAKWGIGLYLREIPKKIYTPYDYVNGNKTDWNLKRQRQNEAMKQVTDWLNTLRNRSSNHQSTKPANVTDIPTRQQERQSEQQTASAGWLNNQGALDKVKAYLTSFEENYGKDVLKDARKTVIAGGYDTPDLYLEALENQIKSIGA